MQEEPLSVVKKQTQGSVVSSERKVSAVITISEADESPERAVQSILENRRFFADVHIVKFGYSTSAELYDGWSDDLSELVAAGLEPIWHSKLDPAKLKTRAIVHIEPDLVVGDGAFITLFEDIEAHPNCDHFAVSSTTTIALQEGESASIMQMAESLTYGFLLVIMMLDTIRSFASLFQTHRTVDLRAQLVTATYPNRVRVAPVRWWMWWFGTGMSTTKRAGAACIQLPSQKDQGFAFVLRTIRTHRYMGIGLWIFAYLIYFLLFAYPIWNPFVSAHSRIGSWIVRDMSSPWWISFYCAHTFVVGYIAWTYMDFPNKGHLSAQVLLYTFYLTASPLLFIYGRFHQSRASWASATTNALNKNKKKKL